MQNYMPKQLSDQEIDRILFKLRERLDFKEQKNVREILRQARREGGIYPEELHKALVKARAEYQISSGDTAAIEEAVFEV